MFFFRSIDQGISLCLKLAIHFSFQMHSFLFVGNYKSSPAQDYSRTSNTANKDDFIKRAEQERQKREVRKSFTSNEKFSLISCLARTKTTLCSD